MEKKERESKARGRPTGRIIVHGTNSGYSYKCRYELCKKAHAEANIERNRLNSKKYTVGAGTRKPRKPTESSILKKSAKMPVLPEYRFIRNRNR